MPELAIIADDLTGALDAAAPFAARGIPTVVALAPQVLPDAIATGVRVVGISTGSRDSAPDAAREAVRVAVAALPAGTRLVKKVDSRLKGNIEAELDAIPHRRSLVVPAIPEFGRWVHDGQLGGFGVNEPIDIRARLGRHASAAVIPDIAEQKDIETALDGGFDLLVGARGLTEAMALAMAPAGTPLARLRAPLRAYCVIGSTDPITLVQLDHLRAGNSCHAFIAAPNGMGPDRPPVPAALTIVQVVPGPVATDAASVAAALAETVWQLAPPAGSLLVLSGGATAQAVLGRLGIRLLELVDEALPGLPLARGGGLTVITKSGGFGEKDTLERLLAPFARVRSTTHGHD